MEASVLFGRIDNNDQFFAFQNSLSSIKTRLLRNAILDTFNRFIFHSAQILQISRSSATGDMVGSKCISSLALVRLAFRPLSTGVSSVRFGSVVVSGGSFAVRFVLASSNPFNLGVSLEFNFTRVRHLRIIIFPTQGEVSFRLF